VLTTEWMEGTKVAQLERLDSQKIDRRAAARTCVQAYCEQIFTDGIYHADPHPGNLLIQSPPVGPPTVVFLNPDGSEIKDARVVGDVGLDNFLNKVARAWRA